MLKFLTVGFINTTAGLSVIYSTMYFFGLSPFLSNAAGYVFGFFLATF
jgi:putative flippase GtrA